MVTVRKMEAWMYTVEADSKEVGRFQLYFGNTTTNKNCQCTGCEESRKGRKEA